MNTNYRKIWEYHNGKIPVDENGRSFEIHHLGGNRENNDLSNLHACSIQEHYDIHLMQKDFFVCFKISERMSDRIGRQSELSSLDNQKRIKNGTHNFLKENRTESMNNTQFTSETAGEISRERVKNGTHNFLKLKGVPKDENWHIKAPKVMRSKQQVTCAKCRKIIAEHHLNRHQTSNGCKQ